MKFSHNPFMTQPAIRKTLVGKDYLVSPLWPVNFNFCLHQGDNAVHDHDFIEIAVILGGEGYHHSINGDIAIGRGDVFILRPGAWHAYCDCRDLQVFNCFFGADFLQRELNFCVQHPLLNYLFWSGPLTQSRQGILSLHLPEEKIAGCSEHIAQLQDIGKPEDAVAQVKWIGQTMLILSYLAEQIAPEANPRNSQFPTMHTAVQQAIQLMESRPAHNWTLPELAQHLHLNPSYLIRLFKKCTGLSPLSYLARYRAEKAARLLLRTNLDIATVGMQVGWSNPSYFSQRFKTHFGLTAGEYRHRFATLSHDAAVTGPPAKQSAQTR